MFILSMKADDVNVGTRSKRLPRAQPDEHRVDIPALGVFGAESVW